jgi:hypothetical protein
MPDEISGGDGNSSSSSGGEFGSSSEMQKAIG